MCCCPVDAAGRQYASAITRITAKTNILSCSPQTVNMEEKEKKGTLGTLRKKTMRRAKNSAPKISGPVGLQHTASGGIVTTSSTTSLDVPRERPQQGAATSDLVKRRYSTRFNQLPDFSNADAPPMPSMPAVPAQYAAPKEKSRSPSRGRGVSPGRGQIDINLKQLKDPALQPEKCMIA